jgi:hypothetical protein
MPKQVVMGATLRCSFGAAPAALIVTSQETVLSSSMLAATMLDFAPLVNIPTFGMCSAPTNPAVSAAGGTPKPCIPVTTPWFPTVPNLLISGIPAIDDQCKCMCAWAGVVSVANAGQATEEIP